MPICPCIALRFSCRVWFKDCDANLMLVAVSLSCRRTGRFSKSMPGTGLVRRRIRRVRILSVGVSIASDGQWLN